MFRIVTSTNTSTVRSISNCLHQLNKYHYYYSQKSFISSYVGYCSGTQINNNYYNIQRRRFFRSGNDSDDDKKNKDKKDNDDTTDDLSKLKEEGGDDDNVIVTSTAAASSVPTKLPFGESAPRLPHMHAIPLVSRPLFPGLITSVTLTDERTIDALEELHNKGDSFISCFLRAKHSTGVISETGTVLTTPEIIIDPADLYPTGTFAQIQRLTRGVANPKPTELDNNSTSTSNTNTSSEAATVILLGHRRVDLISVDELGPPIDVTVKHWPRMEYAASIKNDSIQALSHEVISTIREVAQMNIMFRENLLLYPVRFDANDPYRLADFAASICACGAPEDLQSVLEEKDPETRLHKALVLLIREKEVSKLQKEISQKVEEKLTDAQRKYFLTEQLKSIKKELGIERDDKDAIIEKYRRKLAEYPGTIPDEANKTIEAELDKFATLEKNSAEYNVTRSYLDWLVAIPWNVTTTDNYNIESARTILNQDHYGLDDVKDAILQFMAIGKLKGGSIQGKILCLAGPPGTGKTSIANSIANALGRKFYRFSVGGLSDVSEIKGHRRTYVGAMPGKIIQCLKATGAFNAVCLIDEIDKLGTGYRGDPASALLEVLDPSQNSTFRDYFIDVPVDISQILFICTANELERIPGPLLDRMEIIKLSGYDFPEKIAIAEQYLVPKAMRDSGLMVDPAAVAAEEEKKKKDELKEKSSEQGASTTKADDNATTEQEKRTHTPFDQYVHAEGVPNTLSITKEAITSLVRWYAREAGVRNLAKYIDRITRKLALQVVAESEGTPLTEKTKRKSETWIVGENNLVEYVGKAVFTSDRLYETSPLPSGIVMGLAYTSMGGSALYIETQGIRRGVDDEGKQRGGGSLKATGQLGDVMKESTQIAYTVARARLGEIDPSKSSFFDTNDIHMHVPEGATPKDGPSAGVTMVTAMLSLALDKPVRHDVAMTGEISLTGKVLAVGGIKEKIMGARRAGITHVVLPDSNRRDYDEIPEYLKEGLEVHYADEIAKVIEVAFR